MIGLVIVAAAAALFAGSTSLDLPPRRRSAEQGQRRRVPRRLRTSPNGGPRIVLGVAGGRRVAAEAHHSVLVVGPTQSGKTTSIVIPAVCAWPGPVLISSVKGDVVDATMQARRHLGPVAVIDPSSSIGIDRVTWRPYRSLTSFTEARRLARDLCAVSAAGEQSGDAQFWLQAAARYLAPLLLAAALADVELTVLLEWLSEDAVDGALAILEGAREFEALRVIHQVLSRDVRQLHSIITTAEVVVESLVDGAADGGVDLDTRYLLGNCGTLYCCAPLRDQQRSRGLLTAVRDEMINEALNLASSEGGRLSSPLLVVQDEAAHLSGLESLSALAATGVGQGITVLTVFQDIGQVIKAHGALATSLVLNHRARVVCAGTIDPTTVQLFSDLSGEETRRQWSHTRGVGSRSVTEGTERRPRLERQLLARLRRGAAVVLYDHEAPFVVALSQPVRARRAPKARHARRRGPRRAGVARHGVGR